MDWSVVTLSVFVVAQDIREVYACTIRNMPVLYHTRI